MASDIWIFSPYFHARTSIVHTSLVKNYIYGRESNLKMLKAMTILFMCTYIDIRQAYAYVFAHLLFMSILAWKSSKHISKNQKGSFLINKALK
jgi:hypothetical protein